jgi:hypothetical protein
MTDVAPRPRGLDQLGLVQAIDGFGESVIVRVADYPDRWRDPFLSEPRGEPQ